MYRSFQLNLAPNLQHLFFPRVFECPDLRSGTFARLCSAAIGERSAGSGPRSFATTAHTKSSPRSVAIALFRSLPGRRVFAQRRPVWLL